MRQRNELLLCDLVALRAERTPEQRAVIFDSGDQRAEEVRTYASLWANANRMAAGLLAQDMAYGERFGLIMRNHPEFIEALIGASITGCVAVPIDPRTKGEKLAFTLRSSNCKGIVCGDYVLPHLLEIRAQLPELRWIVVLESREEAQTAPATTDLPGASSTAEWLNSPARSVDVRLKDPADPLQIVYTSGTTGDPKGVILQNQRFGMAASLHGLFNLQLSDRLYTGLSLTHGNAQLLTFAPALGLGIEAVFSRQFTKSRLWDVCRKHGCTVFNLLGGMATAIYSEPARASDADNPIRMVISAGMPKAVWESFEHRFNLRVLELWSAIEGGFTINPVGVGPVGSCGKPPSTLELKVVDENGDECPPNVPGEVITRPAQGRAQLEYFANPQASEKKTHDGWLWSGDVCHRDQDGWLFFDYRKGGGLRHNGDFVNSGYVEKAVAEHPSVVDVFVYGVTAASGAPGEKDVVAAIVPLDARTFDPQALFAHCRRGLEANFVPSYLHVVDEIPKTASEKPQERLLLERFAPDAANVFRQ